MEHPKTLCLCMIVRNESHVVARALRSVRPLIDYWVVCDTGSTDATPVVVLETLSGVPGELHRVKWVNFGHNRTHAIRLARGKADYILILDADMVVNAGGPFKEKLAADYYELRYEGPLDYTQAMLVADGHDWSYVGVTHEYIHAPTATRMGRLDELTLTHLADGAMRADKFERDVRLLTESLEKDPSNPRDTFYLAQSYKDLDDPARALEWYERRAGQEGGWDQERWYAMYQAARMRQLLGQDWQTVLDAYLRAYAARPTRLEPVYEIVKHYREAEEYQLGYLYAAQAGHSLQYPSDLLFIERPVYEYLLWLEYGVCACGAGRVSEAVAAFNQVLSRERLPEWVADAAVRGRGMALELLYQAVGPTGAGGGAARGTRNRLVVLTPFHNPGRFLERCLESLLAQDYENFEVLLVDDASTDGSGRLVPRGDGRVRLFRNPERMGAAYSVHRLLTRHCRPDDIVVCVDGDDWLACADALGDVNRFYNEHDCWVMYSQFQYASGARGFSQPFSSHADFKRLREGWRTSHLRTFRAGLFHSIAEQDPGYECLKDERGEWLTSAVDAALMFPLLELAGFRRARYYERVLYTYNDENPLNTHRHRRREQAANFDSVARKRPFAAIEDYRRGAAAAVAGAGEERAAPLAARP